MVQTRNAARKKQARLTLTPLPSSSPDAIRSRAAAIIHEVMSTPKIKKRLTSSSPLNPKSGGRVFSGDMALPTPLASSQLEDDEQDVNVSSSTSDSISQAETGGRISGKTFGHLARPQYRTTPTKPKSPKKSRASVPFPEAGGFKLFSPHGRQNKSVILSEEDDVPMPSSVGPNIKAEARSSSSEDESDPVLHRASERRRNNKNPLVHVTPTTKPPLTPRSTLSKRDISSRKQVHDDTNDTATISYSDEEHQTPSKRGRSGSILSKNLGARDSDDSSDSSIISPRKRRLFAKNLIGQSEIKSHNSNDQVSKELQEDLDDLRDSEIHKRRTRGRIVNSNKSAKQKQLKELRRRRAGGKLVESSSDSDTLASNPTTHKSKHNEDGISIDSQSEFDEISDTEAVRPSLQANEDEEDSFIEEDDETPLGVPEWRNEIPLEFTIHSMQRPIRNFKIAVQWMIHNKVNPAFARNHTIYDMAVDKLDDEVQGYSGSKFLSPVWNKEFLNNLKQCPNLNIVDVPTMFDHKCDACNRSGHPAKHKLVFSGKPYDRKTLETISSDDDSEDQSKSNTNEQSTTYYLGRTCAANAETGHALYHWRWDLNYYVIEWLKNHGHLTPEQILERAEWSTKKQEKYSNEVIDGMEESGELKILYDEFKQNLEAARNARPERYTYGRK